jgi:two-component system, OmpR family, osmolarity sensor histidine kinase EnvZ
MAARLPSLGAARGVRAVFKRLLPRSLLGRSLLMILLPLLILEGVALEVFYGSHINVVSRRLAGSVAGELGFTIDLMPLPRRRKHGVDPRSRAQPLRSRDAARSRRQAGDHEVVNVFGPMDDDLAPH